MLNLAYKLQKYIKKFLKKIPATVFLTTKNVDNFCSEEFFKNFEEIKFDIPDDPENSADQVYYSEISLKSGQQAHLACVRS